MRKFIRNSWGVRWLTLILCLAITQAQALELGSLSFAHAPAKPLSSITFSTAPGAFSKFARRVGGIAFTTTATSTEGLTIIDLTYVPSAPDGTRLRVTLRDSTGAEHLVAAQIYDWQLKPLAHFVSVGDHAAVTLFGELEHEEARKPGEMIANYHPTLENTLLGLRLLQADMMIFEQNATDLFKDKGEYILGMGEPEPTIKNIKANLRNFENVQQWVKKQAEHHQSYVTGDIDADIRFSMVKGRLLFSGDPTWYCWRRDKIIEEAQIARTVSVPAYVLFRHSRLKEDLIGELSKLISESGNSDIEELPEELKSELISIALQNTLHSFASTILHKLKGTGNSSRSTALVSRYELDEALGDKSGSKLTELFKVIDNRVKETETSSPEEIRRWITELSSVINDTEKVPVIQMKSYSKQLSETIRKERGINPVIYENLRTAVRYAAFFRAAMKENPKMFGNFVASIENIPVNVKQPQGYILQTPTVYPRSIAVE